MSHIISYNLYVMSPTYQTSHKDCILSVNVRDQRIIDITVAAGTVFYFEFI